MVPRAGLEPAPPKRRVSKTRMSTNSTIRAYLEPILRIELRLKPYHGFVIPLYYIGIMANAIHLYILVVRYQVPNDN